MYLFHLLIFPKVPTRASDEMSLNQVYIRNYTTVIHLNPALTDFKGLTNFICYKRNSVTANIGNKRKQVEGSKN